MSNPMNRIRGSVTLTQRSVTLMQNSVTLMPKALLLMVFAAACLTAPAQNESGLIGGVEAEKKLSKRWSAGIEADFRTRNNFKTMDRWSVGIGATYKLSKYLKADAGYQLLDYNNREKISYTSQGGYNRWRPSYWGVKHRVHAGVTGSYKFGSGVKLSLRERWQYTYRPEQTVQTWDFDDEQWEDRIRSGKGKSQLRSRFEISLDKKRALFSPYANIELYNSWGIEKIRYSVGTDIRLSKHHSLGVFYRFQNMKNVDEGEYDPDMHYIGFGYKLKL